MVLPEDMNFDDMVMETLANHCCSVVQWVAHATQPRIHEFLPGRSGEGWAVSLHPHREPLISERVSGDRQRQCPASQVCLF